VRQLTIASRRLTSRIEAPGDVYVLWRCDGREGVSCVRDISMAGISIGAPVPRSVGAVIKVHFLLPEGSIRADAVVRHTRPDHAAGLKFIAVTEGDLPMLAALVVQLRGLSSSRSPFGIPAERKEQPLVERNETRDQVTSSSLLIPPMP
jgi:hypothetical protein